MIESRLVRRIWEPRRLSRASPNWAPAFAGEGRRIAARLSSESDSTSAILPRHRRLEPVAALVHRRATRAISTANGAAFASELLALDIRAANTDAAAVGDCPYAIDPERPRRQKSNGSLLSFGDGNHICPGWQVALHETRVFIDSLMRVPGIRLEREPDMSWNPGLMSYELRNAVVVTR